MFRQCNSLINKRINGIENYNTNLLRSFFLPCLRITASLIHTLLRKIIIVIISQLLLNCSQNLHLLIDYTIVCYALTQSESDPDADSCRFDFALLLPLGFFFLVSDRNSFKQKFNRLKNQSHHIVRTLDACQTKLIYLLYIKSILQKSVKQNVAFALISPKHG